MSPERPPQPVTVENVEPVQVTVTEEPGAAKRRSDTSDARVLTAAGQRRVNILWERTQAFIALSVVGVTLLIAAISATVLDREDPIAFVFLASVSNLVIGFYFGRTNHTRTGGVGPAETVLER